MADNKQLRVTELDNDQIKENLKAFLRSQPEFSDFDFEGAGITQIINLLAYNTHYNAILANASFNETFLDSAIKRGSVVSRAKEMNYTPKSRKSARAVVDISIPDPISTTDMVTMDKYTQFASSVGGTTFSFYNIKPMSVASVDGGYVFENVELFEGRLVTNSFGVESTLTADDTRFTLLNRDVDTDTIEVIVQKSASDSSVETWKLATDISGIDDTSNVFYIQQNSDGYYQVYFGDGVLGRRLSVGNIVRINYLVTHASDANVSASVAQTFSLTSGIAGNGDAIVSTVQNSYGGDIEESIESIKFNAPLALTRNNRTVTANDYWSLIGERMPSVDSVNVYGGEDAEPPVYGKVFISVKPKSGYLVPETVKEDIVVMLRENNILTIIPEFVDPDFTFLTFDIDVRYDPSLTTLSSSDVSATVQVAVHNFFNSYLGKFRNPFYFSKLSRTIDECNDSVVGNVTKFNLQKRFDPSFGQPFYTDFKFDVGTKTNSFFSNVFLYTNAGLQVSAFLRDDGKGGIDVIDFSTSQPIKTGLGAITYENGAVNISALVVDAFVGGEAQLKMNVTPVVEVSNVLPTRNQIITVDDSSESRQSNVLAGIKIKSTPIN